MVSMQGRKKRGYSSPLRQENADATKQRIVAAATELMVGQGYSNTTMAEVAQRSGVAVPTLYISCPGGKPGLAKLVYDAALAGDVQPISQLNRPAVQAILEEPDVIGKLALYAVMASTIHQRVRPVFAVLRAAAIASAPDSGLPGVVSDIERERLAGTRGPVLHLESLGVLRPGLSSARAAEQIYALTSIEIFERLVDVCGWSAVEYEDWLTRMLTAVLLVPDPTDPDKNLDGVELGRPHGPAGP